MGVRQWEWGAGRRGVWTWCSVTCVWCWGVASADNTRKLGASSEALFLAGERFLLADGRYALQATFLGDLVPPLWVAVGRGWGHSSHEGRGTDLGGSCGL